MPQKRPRAEAIDALTDLGEALITVRVCTNLMKEFGDGSEDDVTAPLVRTKEVTERATRLGCQWK